MNYLLHNLMKILFLMSFVCLLIGCGGEPSSGYEDNTPLPWFDEGIHYPIKEITHYTSPEIGDLNGDGLNDVVIRDFGPNAEGILLFYQGSDNTLEPYISFKASAADGGYYSTVNMKIGDMNNDGYMDLAVLAGGVTVFYQDPETHTLEQGTTIPVYEANNDLDIGDLNSDGLNDIVIRAAKSIYVVYQNSNGELGPAQYYDYLRPKALLNHSEVHIADMDGDGDNDIIIQPSERELAIIKQNESGELNSEPEYLELECDIGGFGRDFPFSVGDLNNDGLNDIVAVDDFSYTPNEVNYTTLNIFFQDNTGNMQSPILLDVITDLDGVEIADVNMDGINEILGETTTFDYEFCGRLNVFYQENGSFLGSFKQYRYGATSSGGTSILDSLSIGDVNGDGLPDAVVTWSDDGLFVLPNVTD